MICVTCIKLFVIEIDQEVRPQAHPVVQYAAGLEERDGPLGCAQRGAAASDTEHPRWCSSKGLSHQPKCSRYWLDKMKRVTLGAFLDF